MARYDAANARFDEITEAIRKERETGGLHQDAWGAEGTCGRVRRAAVGLHSGLCDSERGWRHAAVFRDGTEI